MKKIYFPAFLLLLSLRLFGQSNDIPILDTLGREMARSLKSDTSQSNFRVSYFIVGRIRTVELFDGLPFQVKVSALNPNLLEQQIKFRILDLEHFQISYRIGTSETTEDRTFGDDLREPDFRLVIRKEAVLNKDDVEPLKHIEYCFLIHKGLK
jgi:hypothetical protein